jgi:hypothetical protein
VEVLAGEMGIRMLLDDEARCGKQVCGIASSGVERAIMEYLDKTPHKVLGLHVRLIYTESDAENRKMALSHKFKVRIVPDSYRSTVGLDFYGDTSCILLENVIIRIRDKRVTARFRMFFDTLWRMGRDAEAGK